MSVPEAAPYRVDGETLRRDAPILVLLALDVAFGLVMWSRMPARVPIHWGASGEVNGWGPAWVNAFLPPGIALLALTLCAFLPARAGLPALVGGIVVLVLVPVVFSAVLFRRLSRSAADR